MKVILFLIYLFVGAGIFVFMRKFEIDNIILIILVFFVYLWLGLRLLGTKAEGK